MAVLRFLVILGVMTTTASSFRLRYLFYPDMPLPERKLLDVTLNYMIII